MTLRKYVLDFFSINSKFVSVRALFHMPINWYALYDDVEAAENYGIIGLLLTTCPSVLASS